MEVWLLSVPETIGTQEEGLLLAGMLPERRKAIPLVRLPDKRRERLAAYALEGLVLSCAAGQPADRLRLERGPYVKPRLAGESAVQYSLSHTAGWVLLGVDKRAIGVDIERVRPVSSGLMKRYFSPEEQAVVCAPEKDWESRAIEIWTCKEAFGKWTGEGLRRVRGDDWRRDPAVQVYAFGAEGYAAAVCGTAPSVRPDIQKWSLERLCGELACNAASMPL